MAYSPFSWLGEGEDADYLHLTFGFKKNCSSFHIYGGKNNGDKPLNVYRQVPSL